MRILVTYLVLIVMIACTKEEATSKVEKNNSNQQNMVIKAEYTDYYHPYMTYVAGVKGKTTLCCYTVKKGKIIAQGEKTMPQKLKIREKWFDFNEAKIAVRHCGSVVLASLKVDYPTVESPGFRISETACYKEHLVMGSDKISAIEVDSIDTIKAYEGMGYLVSSPGLTSDPYRYYDPQWSYVGLFYPYTQIENDSRNGWDYFVVDIQNEVVLFRVEGQRVIAKYTKKLPFSPKEEIIPEFSNTNKTIIFRDKDGHLKNYILVLKNEQLVEKNN